MAYYGRRRTSDTDLGITGVGVSNQRGQVHEPMSQHGWAFAIGTLGGKTPGGPNIAWRGAIWSVSGSTLTDRLQYSGQVTVSNEMIAGNNGGAILEAPISPSIQLWSGVKYGIGWAATGGEFRHGMAEANLNPIDVNDYYFHYKNTGTSVPSNPFGATSSSFEGAMANYVEYEPNTAPTTTSGTMVPSGSITTSSPDFEGDFDDANEDHGDKLKQFQIQVRRVGFSSTLWDSTQSATSTEQSNRRFVAAYGGSAITPGWALEWRYRVSDQFGVWSDWSNGTGAWKAFTVNAGGNATAQPLSPTKQETRTPSPFTASWTHGSGLSTNAVEVRIKQGGTIIRTSPTIAKTVANGGLISVTWAETGFAQLNWGQALTFQIRGRDTGALWSDWSNEQAFTTNASPTTPAISFPANGQILTARPLVTVNSNDTDDTTATGFAVSLRIKNAAGTLLFTRAMTRNVVTTAWEYQTTATDLATFANYRLDAVATDGTITTPYSAEILFTYSSGPAITVTAPTASQVLTTHTPTISFTQDQTQVSYRVQIYEWVNGDISALAYDSGSVAAAASPGAGASHAVPSGYLHNNTTYRVIISSTNNLAVTGTHGGVTFSVVFPLLPAPTGFTLSPMRIGNDVTPSAIRLSWDEPPYSTGVFRGAVITRRPSGSPITDATILARLTSTSQLDFYDYYPASQQLYTYGLFFEVIQGTDDTETAMVEQDGMVQLDHVVINSVTDGTVRVGLRYGEPYDIEHDNDVLKVQPWGQDHPHIFVGDYHAHNIKGSWSLHDDRYSSGIDDLKGARTLHGLMDTVCWRDPLGDRVFGWMGMKERRGQKGAAALLAITIDENDHVEGDS